jgi:hypothetical protein
MSINGICSAGPGERTEQAATDDEERRRAGRTRHPEHPQSAVTERHTQQAAVAFAHGGRRGRDDPKAHNDDVLYVGMTHSAIAESAALARSLGTANLFVVAGSPHVAFSRREELDAFVATLGLPPTQSKAVGEAIWSADQDARDEMAGIARVWARAERGERAPSRFVLSGHSFGDGVYGEGDTGILRVAPLARLADAMPAAARRVENLFIASCYQGQPAYLEKYVDMFPNLRTAHGYKEMAPSNDVMGMTEWESATRGKREGHATMYNGASWTRRSGFSEHPDLPTLRRDVARKDVFQRYFTGIETARDAHAGPLQDYYSALQNLIGSRDLPKVDEAALKARCDQVLRLRLYPQVAVCFEGRNASTLRAGYSSLGEEAPNFGRLSRKDALAEAAKLERAVSALPDPPPAALEGLRLLRGLRDLDPTVIPPPS